MMLSKVFNLWGGQDMYEHGYRVSESSVPGPDKSMVTHLHLRMGGSCQSGERERACQDDGHLK